MGRERSLALLPTTIPLSLTTFETNYDLAITRLWQYSEGGFSQVSASNIVIWTSADYVTFTQISTNTQNEGLGNGAEPAQDIPTVATGVRYVKIQILNTWDGAVFWNGGVGPNGVDGRFRTGMSQVRFVVNGQAVLSPLLTEQPVSQTNYTGATVTFTVGALDNGVPPLTYQWQKNGHNLSDGGDISGSTNTTLTLTGIGTNDAGNYDVIVSNPTGPSVSWTASLTVLGSPLTGVGITLNPGITFQGIAGYHYQVQFITSLSSTNSWQSLQDIPQLPATPYTVYDPTPVTTPERFYRVVFIP